MSDVDQQQQQQQQQTEQPWYHGLSQELQDDSIIKRYGSLEEAAKGLSETHRSLTQVQQELKKRPTTAVPGADASEDDWKAYREAMGIPAEANGYKLRSKQVGDPAHPERPVISLDGDELKEFQELAHRMNMTPAQAQAMLDREMGNIQKGINMAFEQRDAGVEEAHNALAVEFGGEQALRAALAETGRFREFFGQPLSDGTDWYSDMLKNPSNGPLGNHVGVLRMILRVNAALGSDQRFAPQNQPPQPGQQQQGAPQQQGPQPGQPRGWAQRRFVHNNTHLNNPTPAGGQQQQQRVAAGTTAGV